MGDTTDESLVNNTALGKTSHSTEESISVFECVLVNGRGGVAKVHRCNFQASPMTLMSLRHAPTSLCLIIQTSCS